MRISRYRIDLRQVPVDFLADPDGTWDFDDLVEAAGFDSDDRAMRIGALADAFDGYPAGAAVVSRMLGDQMASRFFAIIECEADVVRELAEPQRIGFASGSPANVQDAATIRAA